jgi:hypothetical protein
MLKEHRQKRVHQNEVKLKVNRRRHQRSNKRKVQILLQSTCLPQSTCHPITPIP